MKILQINVTYHDGSTGMIVEDIHSLCESKGIESYVAYSFSSVNKNDIKNGYKIGNVIGKKAHAVLCRIGGRQAYFSSLATAKFLNYIKKISPDIVLMHNLHSNYINMKMLMEFLHKNRIYAAIALHDCWYHTGGCFHYTTIGCNKWQTDCKNCPKRFEDFPAYLYDGAAWVLADKRRYFSKMDKLVMIPTSRWIQGEIEKSLFSGKEQHLIYNGVDLSIYKPTPSDFRKKHGIDDKFVVLGLASKWLADINKETFDTVVSGLDDDSVLVLIGCKDEVVNSLPDKVIGLPFIRSKQEICEIFTAADVFANCTREDTLSFANIEPQACGTPTITYANTGAQETVDGVCGFAVESGNPEAMLEKINYIKQKGKAAFSESCQNWVKNTFEKQSNYDKYLELFNKLLG